MVNNLMVLGSEAAYFHIMSRNSGASFGKSVNVERTVDGLVEVELRVEGESREGC